jgi:hypothetical protein
MPVLDQRRGVILHVQPNSAKCDLHWIDLEVGHDVLQLAMEVRKVRKSKVLHPVEAAGLAEAPKLTLEEETVERVKAAFPGAEELVDEAWRGWFRSRLVAIIEAGHKQDVLARWPDGVAKLGSGEEITLSQAELLETMACEIETEHEMPFGELKPGSVIPGVGSTPWVSKVVPVEAKPVEGALLDRSAATMLNRLAVTLSPDAKGRVATIQSQATRLKRPIRVSGNGGLPTERRLAICYALVLSAELGEDVALACLEKAIGAKAEKGFVYALSGLSIEQAERMGALARSIGHGERSISIALDGSVVIEDDLAA